MKIQECEEAGMSLKKLFQLWNIILKDSHTFFILENLDTLRKNGRSEQSESVSGQCIENQTGHGFY